MIGYWKIQYTYKCGRTPHNVDHLHAFVRILRGKESEWIIEPRFVSGSPISDDKVSQSRHACNIMFELACQIHGYASRESNICNDDDSPSCDRQFTPSPAQAWMLAFNEVIARAWCTITLPWETSLSPYRSVASLLPLQRHRTLQGGYGTLCCARCAPGAGAPPPHDGWAGLASRSLALDAPAGGNAISPSYCLMVFLSSL